MKISKERKKAYARKYYLNHKADVLSKSIAYAKKNTELVRNIKNSYNRRLRLKVLTHYGLSCVCCGERCYEFLAIDHINGGGHKHRIAIRNNIYNWLVSNNFPPDFQTMCHNCNMAKSFYGVCPHVRMRREQETQGLQLSLFSEAQT